MYGATGRTPPSRFVVVSVLMLAILLASLGVAWWLIQRHPATRGAEILAQLRREGLAAYFHGTTDRWMLHRGPAGQIIGWRLQLIRAEKDGHFHGLDVSVLPSPTGSPKILWEEWRLDGSAKQGEYIAGRLESDRVRRSRSPDTSIKLDNGYLTVQQRALGHTIKSESSAPGNYIPEGMLSLVCLQVARNKTRGRFNFILNSELPQKLRGGYSTLPPFVDVRIQHLPRLKHQVQGAVAAAVATYATREDQGRLIHHFTHVFDNTGKTLAILLDLETGGGRRHPLVSTWLAATRAEVQEKFPPAVEQLRRLGKELSFPLPQTVVGPPQPAPKEGGRETPRKNGNPGVFL